MAHDFQDIILIAIIVLFGDFISMQRNVNYQGYYLLLLYFFVHASSFQLGSITFN
jgi:hypothetical protein